jgi:glycosyltransferase involved in cell wall biosynthesis
VAKVFETPVSYKKLDGSVVKEELKVFVKEHGLEEQNSFPWFIDREEQLKLMSEVIAIIQPSLFEGRSTVVEDAKTMGQWIIASDLAVHKEQLNENLSFFKPSDDMGLTIILKQGIVHGFEKKQNYYEDAIIRFSTEFFFIITN